MDIKNHTMTAKNEIENRDSLTGLLTMDAFLDEADRTLQRVSEEERHQYVFVYGNIRNFKYFNVQYGKEEGDIVLRNYAGIVGSIMQNGLNGRWGQDHIISLTKEENILDLVDRIRNQFDNKYGSVGLQVKVGAYRVRGECTKSSAACEYAKLACDSIRNQSKYYREYDEKLEQRTNLSSYVIAHIDEAIQNQYIQVYYQPVVRTISGKTCGMEALARWIDPKFGFLSPSDFIPALEENHLITKLDLYMLHEICKGMLKMKQEGKSIVPISFNLSRIDFQECDIYAEVDKIVMSYGIPRDMINVEVTETTIMSDPDVIHRTIEQFRAGGYQVWMDDFGSGYSSLNVLKNYKFDEIKLDMKFMTGFDDTTKEIVTSIIAMAKRIGIQTLAEGVETKEQFDFLRYIGCEKAQGYYFSKPLPTRDLEDNPLTKQEKIEKRAWKKYYNQLGTSNFVTEHPLAIVEYDGKDFTFPYMNAEFLYVLESMGVTDTESVYENANSIMSPVSKQFRDFREKCHIGDGIKQMIFSIHDKYIRLSAKCIAEHDRWSAFEVDILNLSELESKEKRTHLDIAGRKMFDFFDTVLYLELGQDTFQVLRQGTYDGELMNDALQSLKKFDEAAEEAAQMIYPAERAEFMRFVDRRTVKERILEAGRVYITKYFRTLLYNGAYVWKSHTILYLADMNAVIYGSRYAPISEEGLLKRIAPEYVINYGSMSKGLFKWIHQGIMESSTINVFWKDTNRRFVGANHAFLETYGFTDVSAILGKTDEDMGWHIEEEPFANDELDVLERGITISNKPGKCMIKGVAHNIIVAKEPIYEDGKIVGLIGCFINADEIDNSLSHLQNISNIDPVTGLMSSQGLINIITEYAEAWQIREQNFATILINATEYQRATESYGEIVAKQMLYEIGQIIAEIVGVHGTCARMYAGNFVVVTRCVDKKKVTALGVAIQQRLDNIHTLSGYDATIHPNIDITFADESNDVSSMIQVVAGGTLLGKQETDAWNVDLNLIWNTYENIDAVVYATDMDTYDIIYMNHVVREDYGISNLNEIGHKKCYEFFHGFQKPCEFCTNQKIMDGKPYDWEFYNQHVNSMYRIKDQMVNVAGRRIRIEVANKVADQSNGTELNDAERTIAMINECSRLALEQSNPDMGIRVMLEYLGHALAGARTYIFELKEEKEWVNTYEWCAQPSRPQENEIYSIPFDTTNSWNMEFLSNRIIMVKDMEDVKENNEVIYRMLHPVGIHSIIIAPIFQEGKLYGFYGIDNPPKEKIEIIGNKIRAVSHVMESMVERRELMKKLEKLSYEDSLTELGNRHAVERYFDQIEKNKCVGIAFCDVCSLKKVNDILGHTAGDELLLQVSTTLKEVFHEYLAFRWGGDELLVIASGIGEDDFKQRCEQLEQLSLERKTPLAVGGLWLSVIREDLDTLLMRADERMYEHKQRLYGQNDVWSILQSGTLQKNEK